MNRESLYPAGSKTTYPARRPEEGIKEYEIKHSLPPAPRAITFLANLPAVSIEDLPPDETTCSICQESFVTKEDEDSYLETPTRLPCNHIIGNHCLRLWILPYGTGERCPLCRAVCLLNNIDYDTSDGLETALDEDVWADHQGGRPLSVGGRATVRRKRYEILQERVRNARRELDRDVVKLDATRRGLRMNYGDRPEMLAHWEERKLSIDIVANSLDAGLVAYKQDGEIEVIEQEKEHKVSVEDRPELYSRDGYPARVWWPDSDDE